jgi:hypothetical protein
MIGLKPKENDSKENKKNKEIESVKHVFTNVCFDLEKNSTQPKVSNTYLGGTGKKDYLYLTAHN